MNVLKKKFWSNVCKTSSCWIWTGGQNPYGYGRISVNNFAAQAHRISYELINPNFDKSLCVLHKCDNRLCVNPKHLFLGTRTENMKDKCNKRRQSMGTGLPQSKLTEKQISYIRKNYANKSITQRQLARKFNIDQSGISRIVNFINWKHV